MSEPLLYTQLEDGTITIDNTPPPESITIDRLTWTAMVTGELAWATVTQDPDNTQHLALATSNVTATFDWLDTLPGRVTLMQTSSWVAV